MRERKRKNQCLSEKSVTHFHQGTIIVVVVLPQNPKLNEDCSSSVEQVHSAWHRA